MTAAANSMDIRFAGTSLRRLLVIGAGTLAACYIAALVLMAVNQRSLFYQPFGQAHPPPAADLPGVREMRLTTSDGAWLRAWYQPPAPGRPLILLFHGTGGGLEQNIGFFRVFTAGGDGMLAIDYRGYPGSTRSPTEDGLLRDGEAAYAFALSHGVPPRHIAILGSSLGTAVAVAVAANHQVGALVLDAPFSSAEDVAADRYWMFPARLIILDRFRSDRRIGHVRAPLLVIHGDQDQTIPIRYGRRLFELAPPPKRFITVPGGGHTSIGAVKAVVQAWIDRNAGG